MAKVYRKNYSKQNPKTFTKHSGASFSHYVPTKGPNKGNNQYITNGWFLRKGDFMKMKCVTTQKSILSDKGWMGSIACTMLNRTTGEEKFFWGTMHKATGKVVIDKLAMVLNPKAPNGGYCGTFIVS